MASTQLYNENGDAIYPKAESEGVLYNNTTVKKTLDDLIAQVNRIDNTQSGADLVLGDLDIKISYIRLKDDNLPSEDDSDWSNTMVLPDGTYPYLWKKTIYLWKDHPVHTTIEIVSTSLYPQTQYMYIAHKATNGSLKGPSKYADGAPDLDSDQFLWYTTPQSVDSNSPLAFMSIRTREPGKPWSKWSKPALYGSYAFDAVTDIRYYAYTENTIPNEYLPNHMCNSDNGQLTYDPWKTSIDYNNLPTGIYYIFTIHGVAVDNRYQKVYDGLYWSTPSIISVITKS